eukprot:COSAG03_NODE_713_length_6149_cov_3.209256_3_plen_69_part_00
MYKSTSPGIASDIAVSSGSVRARGRSRRLYREDCILFLTLDQHVPLNATYFLQDESQSLVRIEVTRME